jgi:hypothetical protein
MSGIFWFKSAKEFMRRAKKFKGNSRVSPGMLALTTMLANRLNLGSAFITNNIVDVGVPKDYELYLAKHKRL